MVFIGTTLCFEIFFESASQRFSTLESVDEFRELETWYTVGPKIIQQGLFSIFHSYLTRYEKTEKSFRQSQPFLTNLW